MLTKMRSWPITGPIIRLLEEEAFILWVGSAVTWAVINVLPHFQPVEPELNRVMAVITTLLSGLVIATVAGDDIQLDKLGLLTKEQIQAIGVSPILDPIKRLLGSRKAIQWAAQTVVAVAIVYIPALEQVQGDMVILLVQLLGGLAVWLLGATYVEKAARRPHEVSQ